MCFNTFSYLLDLLRARMNA